MWWEVSDRIAAALWSDASRICPKLHVAFLSSSHLAFSSHFVTIPMVHLYNRINTVRTCKKSIFILSLIGIILRWGFLIWELIFIYCELFVLILVGFFFCVVSSFTTFRPNFHLWPSSGDLPRPQIGMMNPVTVSTVITAFHEDNYKNSVLFNSDPTIEDQIRIYKTKKSILDRPSGPVAQRIEALSLCGSRWALSEDSGFKSYSSQKGDQKGGVIDSNYGRQ